MIPISIQNPALALRNASGLLNVVVAQRLTDAAGRVGMTEATASRATAARGEIRVDTLTRYAAACGFALRLLAHCDGWPPTMLPLDAPASALRAAADMSHGAVALRLLTERGHPVTSYRASADACARGGRIGVAALARYAEACGYELRIEAEPVTISQESTEV